MSSASENSMSDLEAENHTQPYPPQPEETLESILAWLKWVADRNGGLISADIGEALDRINRIVEEIIDVNPYIPGTIGRKVSKEIKWAQRKRLAEKLKGE